MGADLAGLALPPGTSPSLFNSLAPWPSLKSIIGDLREQQVASSAFAEAKPEIVIHMAAQALVRPSYSDPVGTFATNILGTVHLLEEVRRTPSVRVVLIVTSDKVYENAGDGRPLDEDSPLGGPDPYSASKACQEIVTSSYRQSFFRNGSPRIASARSGNVVGGGDWSVDRVIPDFFRAVTAGEPMAVRHPEATRPWQYILDLLAGYLLYAQRLYEGPDAPLALNFGPATEDECAVREVIEALAVRWGSNSRWIVDPTPKAPEAKRLTLDASLAARILNWRPRLRLDEALDRTVAWHRAQIAGYEMRAYSLDEIRRYQELVR